MPPAVPKPSMTELLEPYLWPFVISLGVTIVMTPIVRAIAVAGRIYDQPDALLKPHAKPIPYLGGVAIYCGWAAGLLSMFWLMPDGLHPESHGVLIYVLIAGTIMMLTGLVDDLVDLRPRTKLLCQLVAAGVLVYGDVGRGVLPMMIGWLGYVHPPEMLERIVSSIVTVMIVIAAGNATNLIDGLDGLCSGVTGIICVGFAVIAAHLAADGNNTPGDPVRLIIAFALLGSCLGFLRYNFNPAQVFMGDAGSLLLGFNAAVILLLFVERNVLRWFLGACMVFSLPVFDTALAILRRWLNGRPLMQGDRSHFYDQLRDRGFTVRQTVAIAYLLAAGLAAIGCLVIVVRTRYSVMIFMLVVACVWLTVLRLGMLRMDTEPPPRANNQP